MNIAQMTFKEFVSAIIIRDIIQPITTLLLALAILYFLWNVVQFIRKNDKPEEIEKFKTHTMWGIVAIFVMVSVWGLVQILVTSFVPGSGIPVFNAGTSSSKQDPYSPSGINKIYSIPGSNATIDWRQTSFWDPKDGKWKDGNGNPTGNIGDGVSPRQTVPQAQLNSTGSGFGGLYNPPKR